MWGDGPPTLDFLKITFLFHVKSPIKSSCHIDSTWVFLVYGMCSLGTPAIGLIKLPLLKPIISCFRLHYSQNIIGRRPVSD